MDYEDYKESGLKGDIKSLREEIADLRHEQRMTNALLRLLVNPDSKRRQLPKNKSLYSQKSFTIVHDSYLQVREWVSEIAKRDGKKMQEVAGNHVGDVSATITSLDDDDYLLIKVDILIGSEGVQGIISEAYTEHEISITIGKGEGSQDVKLPVPKINYIIYTDIEKLVPCEMLKMFPVIEMD